MSDRIPVRRALLSVSDKTGLAAMAQCLAELGVQVAHSVRFVDRAQAAR